METPIKEPERSIDVVSIVPQNANHSGISEANHELNESLHGDNQLRSLWNRFIWHGGSVYDAWLNAAASQVGQVILSMPTSYAQMGFGLGVLFHLLYAFCGIWTCYLLASLYLEYRTRKEKQGNLFKMHIIQYHEVMGDLVGPWLRNVSLCFNIATMAAVATLQIIACGSNAYYLNPSLNKREWAVVFGAVSLLTTLLPSFHNFRLLSFIGIVTTTYTAWFMFIASLVYGQVEDAKHSGPEHLETFFTGTTNILFAFGGHAITVEIMHAMWKPRSYKYVYVAAVLYVLTITLPHSLTVYWAFGDKLLTHSNAFSIFPKSIARDIGLVFMIIHQAIAFGLYVMPLNFMWEKLLGVHQGIYLVRVLARLPVALLLWFLALLLPFFGPLNSLIGSFITSFSVYIIPCVAYLIIFWKPTSRKDAVEKMGKWMPSWMGLVTLNTIIIIIIFVLGVCFGGWASVTNLVDQVNTFGVFDKCYQCKS